jgi:hypothetical protein
MKRLLVFFALMAGIVFWAGCSDDGKGGDDSGDDKNNGAHPNFSITAAVLGTWNGTGDYTGQTLTFATATGITGTGAIGEWFAMLIDPENLAEVTNWVITVANGAVRITLDGESFTFMEYSIANDVITLRLALDGENEVIFIGQKGAGNDDPGDDNPGNNNALRAGLHQGAPSGLTPASVPLADVAANNLEEAFMYAEMMSGTFTLVIDRDVSASELALMGESGRITMTIIGSGGNRTIQLAAAELPGVENRLFSIMDRSVSLTIGNNITLKGASSIGPLVNVMDGGTFIMEDGSKITGHTNTASEQHHLRGTVSVRYTNSVFIMRGGEITGNTDQEAAVRIGGATSDGFGSFRMEGGIIHGNSLRDENPMDVFLTTAQVNFTHTGGFIAFGRRGGTGGGSIAVPTNLTVEVVSEATETIGTIVRLTFTTVPGASGYAMYIRRTDGTYAMMARRMVDVPGLNISGTTANFTASEGISATEARYIRVAALSGSATDFSSLIFGRMSEAVLFTPAGAGGGGGDVQRDSRLITAPNQAWINEHNSGHVLRADGTMFSVWNLGSGWQIMPMTETTWHTTGNNTIVSGLGSEMPYSITGANTKTVEVNFPGNNVVFTRTTNSAFAGL